MTKASISHARGRGTQSEILGNEMMDSMTSEQKAALANVITVDKEIMHGTPCFTNTRVPVQTLIDFLETGESIDAFLSVYPYIPREQVHSFLELGKELTIEQVCASSQTPALILK